MIQISIISQEPNTVLVVRDGTIVFEGDLVLTDFEEKYADGEKRTHFQLNAERVEEMKK